MSDELDQIILADAASSVAEEPPRRRGIFGLRRRSKLPAQPLTHCENCGAPLTGEFCSQCGQHAIDYRRSILRVVLDAADSFLNWDTKFLQTLKLLLLRPWQLTNDFNTGRRARYVHPLRLYLIASLIFFLMARAINWDSSGPIELTTQDRVELVASLGKLTAPDSPLTPEQRERVEAARTKLSEGQGVLTEQERAELKTVFREFLKSTLRKKLDPGERAKMSTAIASIPEPPDPVIETKPGDHPVSATPKPRKKDPLHFTMGKEGEKKTPFALWLERQVKEKIGEDGAKLRPFLDTLRNNIPVMMLCCIPLFAFVLKILYIRKQRYYVEHLVHALHIHTFLYVAVVITSLAAMGATRTAPALHGLVVGLMSCAILIQIFRSIRHVYKQGWFFTTVKFLFGGFVYFLILFLAVIATTLVTLLLPS
jgi:hypothetical protein